jgi:hypothetical protein
MARELPARTMRNTTAPAIRRLPRAIPLSARIVALADVYDALTTQRVTNPPTPTNSPSNDLEGSGRDFDPMLFRLPACEEPVHAIAGRPADSTRLSPSLRHEFGSV